MTTTVNAQAIYAGYIPDPVFGRGGGDYKKFFTSEEEAEAWASSVEGAYTIYHEKELMIDKNNLNIVTGFDDFVARVKGFIPCQWKTIEV